MTRAFLVVAVALLATSCSGPEQPKSESKSKSPAPQPADESSRLPKANQTATRVIDKELGGKAFMPGGTVGRYKHGTREYEIFIGKLGSANDAAFLLLDWKRELQQAHFLASYGGYFGTDAGRPVFVFTKGPWIAGIAGLPEKEADAEARVLASALN